MQSSMLLQHLVVDERGRGEELAAVNDAMADGVDVGSAANPGYCALVGGDVANQVFEGGGNIA